MIESGGAAYDNAVIIEPVSGLTVNYATSFQLNFMFDSIVPSYFYPAFIYSIDYSIDQDYLTDIYAFVNVLDSKRKAV